ncbi:MAG: hypothetical protein P4L11_04260 [Geothrix sp.]|nr:hypothetical protein [Geothrix sp.]
MSSICLGRWCWWPWPWWCQGSCGGTDWGPCCPSCPWPGWSSRLSGSSWPRNGWPRHRAGRGRRLSRALGTLLRFGLFGLIGVAVASALAANHHLGGRGEDLVGGLAGGLTGLLGTGLYHRLGRARFWPLFGWFALALLGSFVGGILGILGPEPWSIDAGILVPPVLFLILALSGRLGTRQRAASPDAVSPP